MTLALIGEDFVRALLQGTPPGTVYALIGLGFVLTYKTSGVFNLAFGAQAYISAAMFFKARQEWGWGIVPAVVLSVFVIAPAIGLTLERLIFRNLRTASAVSKLVIAIGLSVALPALFELIADYKPVAGRTPTGIVPDGSSVFYDPTGVYPFSRDELAQIIVAGVGVILLGAMFRFTSMGLAMRGVVESPRMTELAGIPADRVSALAWAISSIFAGMAGVLIAPRLNTLISNDFFTLMVLAMAAAAVGRLVSLPGAFFGGMGLGWFIAVFNTYLPRWADDHTWLEPFKDNLTPSLPFVVLFGILVFWPAIRRAVDAADPLSGVDPPPPALAATTRHPLLTLQTRIFGVCFLGLEGWLGFTQADVRWIALLSTATVLSIIYLSILFAALLVDHYFKFGPTFTQGAAL